MRHLKILNAEKGFCRFVVCRFCRILRRIGAPGHIFRALYPMLFMQNLGALLTV